MANYVIVGAGASGLYTAYRLLQAGRLCEGDTVNLYEWGQTPGGRIFTYKFNEPQWKEQGLYVELGGMRFSADKRFPNLPEEDCEGHVLVQTMILEMGLGNKVRTFGQSYPRLYYLRGKHFYENQLRAPVMGALPYGFNQQFLDFLKPLPANTDLTADTLLGQVAGLFAPNLGSSNKDRRKWCTYYESGLVPRTVATKAFPAATPITDIGYWNMLYDQLGDEGFDYVSDGTGYSSNVMNWNSADAMQANNDYGSGSPYMRIDGGYSQLFFALAAKIDELGGKLHYGHRLASLKETQDHSQTTCTFHNAQDQPVTVVADHLFLAMPRRSLELVAEGCEPTYMLNLPEVKLWLESSLDQPAIKAVLVFDEAWWTHPDCLHPPVLLWPPDSPQPPPTTAQQVGGATITDLPLRMVYYFANNVVDGPGASQGPYVLLASYDDMNYSDFWRQMEISGEYTQAPSTVRQPLTGPTALAPESPFAQLLVKQLAEVHGMQAHDIPMPSAVYFQDWGQDPFGGGYHGWASHYNICKAMDSVRAPYEKILNRPKTKTYIVGSCYSFDQAWVEGAFCTAESVLRDFLHIPAARNTGGYHLVCTPGKTGPEAKA